MSGAAIVLAVVAGLLLVVSAVLARALVRTRRDRAALQERLDTAETELEATTARMNAAEIEAGRALTKAANERERAAAADRATAEAEARVEQIEAASRRTERDLRSRLIDPGPFGGLEAVRISRLWQQHVPGPGEPLPVDTDDEIHAAVVVLAEASREETGTTVDVTWAVEPTPAPALALTIVRAAEELIAAARDADTAALEIRSDPAGVVRLRMQTEPAIDVSPVLAEALRTAGWVETLDTGQVVLRLTP